VLSSSGGGRLIYNYRENGDVEVVHALDDVEIVKRSASGKVVRIVGRTSTKSIVYDGENPTRTELQMNNGVQFVTTATYNDRGSTLSLLRMSGPGLSNVEGEDYTWSTNSAGTVFRTVIETVAGENTGLRLETLDGNGRVIASEIDSQIRRYYYDAGGVYDREGIDNLVPHPYFSGPASKIKYWEDVATGDRFYAIYGADTDVEPEESTPVYVPEWAMSAAKISGCDSREPTVSEMRRATYLFLIHLMGTPSPGNAYEIFRDAMPLYEREQCDVMAIIDYIEATNIINGGKDLAEMILLGALFKGLALESAVGRVGVAANAAKWRAPVHNTCLPNITRWSSGPVGAGRVTSASVDDLLFGQANVGVKFGNGQFAGQTIGSVAARVRSGLSESTVLQVDVIRRGHQLITLNNRTLTTIRRSGVQRVIARDRTGIPDFEKQLLEQLRGVEPSRYIRIRAGGPGMSSID
jgi:hypothetical protein